MITSSSNAQIKYLVKLQEKSSARKSDSVFVCEGRKMFEEVLTYDRQSIVKAYVTESFLESFPDGELSDIDYETVSDNVMKDAAQTVTPQGVLAIVRQPKHSLDSILSDSRRSLSLLLLENLRDPGNLGTIIRTAEGAGMDAVILSPESVDVFNPKVIRSTMGAIYRVPIVYSDHFYALLEEFRQQGILVYAAHLKGSVEYDTVDYPNRFAIMIGNEANGLTDRAAEAAHQRIRIPMEGKVESLNAGVAAAILMYEAKRQHKAL